MSRSPARVLVMLGAAAALMTDRASAATPPPIDNPGDGKCLTCGVGGAAGPGGIDVTTTDPGRPATPTSPALPASPGGGGAPAVPVSAPAPARPRTYYDIRPVCYASAGTDAACAAAYDCPDPGSYRALVYSGPTP